MRPIIGQTRLGGDMPELTLNDIDWVYTYQGTVLHHATFTPEAEREMDDYATAIGSLDCGRGERQVWIPGMFSRMGMKRCDRCCVVNGLPKGIGSPKNDDECRKILGLPTKHL
jgi:hypothetical protein